MRLLMNTQSAFPRRSCRSRRLVFLDRPGTNPQWVRVFSHVAGARSPGCISTERSNSSLPRSGDTQIKTIQPFTKGVIRRAVIRCYPHRRHKKRMKGSPDLRLMCITPTGKSTRSHSLWFPRQSVVRVMNLVGKKGADGSWIGHKFISPRRDHKRNTESHRSRRYEKYGSE